MKIISWNVNSVRARIDNIKSYIKESSPDILLLQEIKTQNENFPKDEFEKLGYKSYVFGQKVEKKFFSIIFTIFYILKIFFKIIFINLN